MYVSSCAYSRRTESRVEEARRHKQPGLILAILQGTPGRDETGTRRNGRTVPVTCLADAGRPLSFGVTSRAAASRRRARRSASERTKEAPYQSHQRGSAVGTRQHATHVRGDQDRRELAIRFPSRHRAEEGRRVATGSAVAGG